MALLIDTPRWPAHGRLWAHLVSDTSLAELHAFAEQVGIPERSFEGDHYDVPGERHGEVVAAGARLVEGRELVNALRGSGLRLPKRKGERVLATWADPAWPPDVGPHHVDCIASPLPPPAGAIRKRWLIALDDDLGLAVDGTSLPTADGDEARCGYLRVRPTPPRPLAAGPSTAPWGYAALHLRRGALAGLRHVPQAEVRGVEAQPHWWPLLLHVQRRRPGAAGTMG